MLNLTRLHLGIAHESQFQGLGIRPHVHLPTAEVGRVVDAPSGSRICPEEVIDGDAFRFKVPDGLSFGKGENQ
jgi:hypothetical protein